MESLLITETTSIAGHFRNAGLSTLSSAVFFSSKQNQGALKVFHKP